MAAAFEKHLVAAQRFLAGLTTLPTYADASARQLTKLTKSLEKISEFSTKQSADILAALDVTLWDESSLAAIRARVAERTDVAEPETVSGRRQNQDFLSLPQFIPEWLWRETLDAKCDPAVVLEKLCCHAFNLGLRLPSEPTLALLCALAYQREVMAMSGNAKHRLVETKKPIIRKWLQGQKPAVYLDALPGNWDSIPEELRRKAFPSGQQPLPPPPSHLDFYRLATTWPVRTSNRLAADGALQISSAAGPDVGALGRMADAVESSVKLAQDAQAMAQAMWSKKTNPPPATDAILALEDGTVEESSAPAKAAADEAAPPAQQAGSARARATAPLSVQQQLRELQSDWREQAHVAKRPASRRPAQKRPASRSEPQSPKRPSRHSNVFRKPAAAGMKGDTRKKFTSRAYHAAKKQVQRNGGSDRAALEAARKALREASAAWDAARA